MATGDWHEVAARVYRRRFDPCDVTVTAVLGEAGVAVVDTRCSPAEARELKELIRRLTALPVRWVVNTHAHFDHTWGNAEFLAPRLDPPARIWAHRRVPGRLRPDEAGLAEVRALLPAAGLAGLGGGLDEFEPAEPTDLVGDRAEIDLGGRILELRHHGRGHTDGDLWVAVPDAGVVLAGDQVEQSGPPAFGPDSFPLEWPGTLDRALAWMAPDTTVVPGHGEPVDRAFVEDQRTVIEAISRETARLYADGVRVRHAAEAGTWPVPVEAVLDAVRRGYAALAAAGPAGPAAGACTEPA
jgi:glyoxylase-like metal-dependent hydrolase (beta-lactamase superfamily II)